MFDFVPKYLVISQGDLNPTGSNPSGQGTVFGSHYIGMTIDLNAIACVIAGSKEKSLAYFRYGVFTNGERKDNNYVSLSDDLKTVKWWSIYDAASQLNASDDTYGRVPTYYYIAFG